MRCAFIQHCRNHAAALPEAHWYAMISNLAVFDCGDAAIHELSHAYAGYNYAETQDKIHHFLESGTKPITCAKIAETGFVCPKIADGSCTCKSPASLCYLPADLDTLRALLGGLSVSRSITDDMQTAQRFVCDYCANVESTIAAAFIENELRQRFGFKVSSLKSLLAEQKILFKKTVKDKELRGNAADCEIPEWYTKTDKGGLHFLPDVLADYLARNLSAFYSASAFFAYEDGVYSMRDDLWALATVKSYMLLGHATLNGIKDAIGQWKALIQKPVSDINADPFIINLKNGLLGVMDGSFNVHTPEHHSTVRIGASHDPGAVCPQFLSFLNSLLNEREVWLIQEILGYLMIPVNKAQRSFLLVGAPNAGKSTLLSVIQEILLGSENVSNIPWQNLSDRFNKAELFGKLANIFADLPNKSLDDGGMFKALTGEDFISAERKNRNPFTFRPYARLVFSCNEIPRNYGDRSEGFYRRLLIIRFAKSVPEERRDPNLREKLASERDGIFEWALTGLKRLIDRNYQFTETESTHRELRQYKVDCNSALSFFEERCEIAADAECSREEVFAAYRDYCQKNGFVPMSQIRFNHDIETAYQEVKRASDRLGKRRTWRGMRLGESS
jgi:putative DNA primase/helicase